MDGAGNFVMLAGSGDVPRAAVGAEYRLAAVRHLFPERQAGAVLDPRALSRRAGEARQAGLRLFRRAGGRIPAVQARSIRSSARTVWPGRPKRRRSSTPRTAFSISPRRATTRSSRSSKRCAGPCRRSACRCARSRSSSGRASTSSPSRRKRTCAGRHDGAVPQRREAGGAPARLSAELHVPAALAECLRQRLASAPVAARPQNREERIRFGRSRPNCCRRSAAISSAGLLAHARAGRGLRDADGQRLQALSRRELDGADPGDLGATTTAA